jgi:hypothetical protein
MNHIANRTTNYAEPQKPSDKPEVKPIPVPLNRQRKRIAFTSQPSFKQPNDDLETPTPINVRTLSAALLCVALGVSSGCTQRDTAPSASTKPREKSNVETPAQSSPETPNEIKSVRIPDNRPMIIGNMSQCADLYWNGQINDSKGYRWDVFIIPGVGKTFADAGCSYARAGGYIRRYGTTGLARDGEENTIGTMYRIAGKHIFMDYMARGVKRDYQATTTEIAAVAADKPFGWYAYIGYQSIWGYVIKPTGRVISGTVASAMIGTTATACGTIEGAGRGVVATGDVVSMGTIVPVTKLLWHHPAYMASLFNAEPKLEHDGKWGLRIINRQNGSSELN